MIFKLKNDDEFLTTFIKYVEYNADILKYNALNTSIYASTYVNNFIFIVRIIREYLYFDEISVYDFQMSPLYHKFFQIPLNMKLNNDNIRLNTIIQFSRYNANYCCVEYNINDEYDYEMLDQFDVSKNYSTFINLLNDFNSKYNKNKLRKNKICYLFK